MATVLQALSCPCTGIEVHACIHILEPLTVLTSYCSLLKANPNCTKQEVEDNFDGNICRCTGYRPILDAMKSFASEDKECNFECVDIEVNARIMPTLHNCLLLALFRILVEVVAVRVGVC